MGLIRVDSHPRKMTSRQSVQPPFNLPTCLIAMQMEMRTPGSPAHQSGHFALSASLEKTR
jgi:hypothetical protein